MRIAVRGIYTRYPHWGAHSGMNQLMRHLDATRYAVRVYAASDGDADLPLPHDRLRQCLRERVQRRGMAWYGLSDLVAELRALPGCLSSRTAIVHYLDAEHSAQYLPALLRRSRISRTRTVATYHQPPDLLDGLVDPRVVVDLDHVTVVSPTQLPYFGALLPPEKLELVLHGVDTEFFRPGTPRPAAGPFRCITAGHWMRDWQALRAVSLELAGRCDVELHVVTDRETGLEDRGNVVLHRHVDDPTLRALYQGSDLLLLPLTGSTANNTLLEGIACALPVVSTELPSVRAYVPGPEAVLVAGNEPHEMARAVLHLLGDPRARSAMAHAARARARELSWPNVARRFAAIYSRLASPGSR